MRSIGASSGAGSSSFLATGGVALLSGSSSFLATSGVASDTSGAIIIQVIVHGRVRLIHARGVQVKSRAERIARFNIGTRVWNVTRAIWATGATFSTLATWAIFSSLATWAIFSTLAT